MHDPVLIHKSNNMINDRNIFDNVIKCENIQQKSYFNVKAKSHLSVHIWKILICNIIENLFYYNLLF